MTPPGVWGIVILGVLVLVLFGARRLPDIASSVGKSLKIVKGDIRELSEDEEPHRPR